MVVVSYSASPAKAASVKGWVGSLHMSTLASALTEAATKASNLTGYPVLPYLVEDLPVPGSTSIDNGEVAQVCIYTFQHVMAIWLETLGIQAHAVTQFRRDHCCW